MNRCWPHLLAMLMLLGLGGDSLFGKHLVEIPQEVVAGWQRLADQSKTYRILFSQRRHDGGQISVPIIISRLDNKYVKFEDLKRDANLELKAGEHRDFTPDIQNVFLYDGSEYFNVLRLRPASKFTLGTVGKSELMESILKPNVPIGPEVNRVHLLDLIHSETNQVQSFEKDESGCYLTYLEPPSGNVPQRVVRVKLDPSHDYRPEFATIQTPEFRVRNEFLYEDHPAIPAEVRNSSDKPNAPVAGIRYHKLLTDQKVTADQFQLEHYGLPPYRRRSQWNWPMIAVTVGGAGLVVCAVYWWRRNRNEN